MNFLDGLNLHRLW